MQTETHNPVTAFPTAQHVKEGMRRVIATHEAGHAVIGRVLTVPCGDGAYVDLDRDPAGFADLGSYQETKAAWQQEGRHRRKWSPNIAMAIAGLAGREAEVAIIGRDLRPLRPTSPGSDTACVAELLHGAPDWVMPRLRRFTRTLIARHMDAIKAVAKRLLQDGTLSDAQIREIMSSPAEDQEAEVDA